MAPRRSSYGPDLAIVIPEESLIAVVIDCKSRSRAVVNASKSTDQIAAALRACPWEWTGGQRNVRQHDRYLWDNSWVNDDWTLAVGGATWLLASPRAYLRHVGWKSVDL